MSDTHDDNRVAKTDGRKLASTAWAKGQSGNPQGRTAPQMSMAKNLARYIAERTRNGEDFVDRMLQLAGLDPEHPMPAHNAAERRVALAAMEALLDRGAGKATQEVQLTLTGDSGEGARSVRLRRLDVADLEVIARLDLDDPDGEQLGEGDREVAALGAGLAALEIGGDQPLAGQIIDATSVER